MISKKSFQPQLVDVSCTPRPVVGLPDGVVKYRVRLRPHSMPMIFLRFRDRISQHVLLLSGDNYEPFEAAEAVNLFPSVS